MDIINGNIVSTIKDLLKSKSGVEIPDEEISNTLRQFNFSQTLDLVDMLKSNEIEGIISLFKPDNSDDELDEAGYGTQATITPTSTTIKAQTTKDVNAQRRANNSQQDANRDSSATQRTVAGASKQPTGQGANRMPANADPDDVQRSQNADAAGYASDQASQNTAEIERLKQLAFGRR